MTSAVINRPFSTMRSVPRITATLAFAAAAANGGPGAFEELQRREAAVIFPCRDSLG